MWIYVRACSRLLLAVLLLMTGSCYVTRQAWHQNNLINSRQKLDEVIASEATPPAVRQKLAFLKQILAFAQAQGQNLDNAYRYYVDTNGQPVSYLLQAAYADRLESKTWWFPIVGQVPYLGFYALADRERDASQLESQGFDIYRGEVGAFSSLGWFEDPIFSPMIQRSDVDLAHLFFHELTHRTLWIPGSVEFNENMAEFVADHLVELFFLSLHRSQELQQWLVERDDKVRFHQWLTQLREALKKNYDQPERSSEEKLQEKSRLFARYLGQEFPAFKSERYQKIKKIKWNNATVLGMSLYSPDTTKLKKAYQCAGVTTIGQFLTKLETMADRYDQPEQALDAMCISKS